MSEKYTVGVDHGGLSGRAFADPASMYEPIPENPAGGGVMFAKSQPFHHYAGCRAPDVMHRPRAVSREAIAERQQRPLAPATQEATP